MTIELIEQWDSDINWTYLKLNSYWGGSKHKRCIQLTINTREHACYAQMTFDNARKFFQKALNELDKIEKQFNENPPWWEVLSHSQEESEDHE